MIQVVFIFFPFYFTGAYLLFLFFYLLINKEISAATKEIKGNKLLLLFIITSFLASIVNQNLYGILISIIFVISFSVIAVYKKYSDINLFFLIIKVSTFMSLICALVALFQFIDISHKVDHLNMFLIEDDPKYRIKSVFINANYYAAILEFIILMAFYKLALVKDKESSFSYYFLVIIINIFFLYLTGCRSAWFALFAAIPIIFLFQRNFYIALSLFIISMFVFFLTINIEIFPRLDTILNDLNTRFDIWKASIKTFLQHPLIGIGPFGFENIVSSFNFKVNHSHSLYFETLLSFGIIGTSFLFFYFLFYLKELFESYRLETYPLIIGILAVTFLHNILDVTILNLQVGLLFLFIIASIGVYKEEENVKQV